MKRHIVIISALIISIFIFISNAHAAFVDPSNKWQSITTKHFRINFPKRLEDTAVRSARICEEIYPGLTQRWDWKPWGLIEIILTDDSDDPNGWASVLPYNWIMLWITPPEPDDAIANYDDWLKMLISHELTHVIQLDGAEGFWRFPRVLLGKIIAPSGVTPSWMHEGLAQIEETRLTDGGRGRGSYSEMVIRSAILGDEFLPIDQATGWISKWPGGYSIYIYGLKFVDYLITTYGEDKFHQFDKRIRRSPLLFAINRQAKKVYGKTVVQLWKEWKDVLTKRYDDLKKNIEGEGLTDPTVVVEQVKYSQLRLPTLSPDGKRFVYVLTSPHHGPEIRVRDLEGGKDELLVKDKVATYFSWNPDGKKIAFSSAAKYKRYHYYYDIWMYDFETKKTKRLTTGERARDPEFIEDGKKIMFVQGKVLYDEVAVMNVPEDEEKKEDRNKGWEKKRIGRNKSIAQPVKKDEESKPKIILSEPKTQFAYPRVSPDGKSFLIVRHDGKNGWRVVRYDIDGTHPKRLTTFKGMVMENHPIWHPNGKEIFYISDRNGIDNIYRYKLSDSSTRRVTNVLGGLFQPSTHDGKDIYISSYSATGFNISKVAIGSGVHDEIKIKDTIYVKEFDGGWIKKAEFANFEKGEKVDAKLSEDLAEPKAGENQTELKYKEDKYVAFGVPLFLPRFISPMISYADDTLFVTALTGGFDPLRWHNWTGGINYRTDADHLGYFFSYFYNRFRPVLGLGTYEAIAAGGVALANNQVYYEKRRTGYASLTFPFNNWGLSFGYSFSDHNPKTVLTAPQKAPLNLGYYGTVSFSFTYGDAKKYVTSISKESGRYTRLYWSMADKAFGSRANNEQIVFVGDHREYIHLGGHQVLALRAKGGITWNDKLFQNTFVMGGSVGESLFTGGSSITYFPLRGMPYSRISGERAMLLSAEYRFPIVSPERGISTWPVFLKSIHGALFTDYGNVWFPWYPDQSSFKHFFDDFLLSVGAEVRGSFVIGHALPIEGRLGYGIIIVNRGRFQDFKFKDPITGANIKDGVLILEFGTSF
ncbi:MAG: hypothetical protein ABIE74_13070 [Pseudomonadota bacterium]